MSGITPEAREAAAEAYRAGTGWDMSEGRAVVDAFVAGAEWAAGVLSHPTREQIIDVIESAWTDEDPDFSGVIADALLAADHLWTTPAGGDISTVEELNALPVGSVIRTSGEGLNGWGPPRVAEKVADGDGSLNLPMGKWQVADGDEFEVDSDELDDLPARVLFVPSGAVPAPAGEVEREAETD